MGNKRLPMCKNYMSNIIMGTNTLNDVDINKIYEYFMREGCRVGLHSLPYSTEIVFLMIKFSN
jgi:hypothetical protein